MKKFNFFAIVLSVMLLASCGEQRQQDQDYDATEPTQEAPSDVYNDEGDAIEQDEDVIQQDEMAAPGVNDENQEIDETPMDIENQDQVDDTTTVQ